MTPLINVYYRMHVEASNVCSPILAMMLAVRQCLCVVLSPSSFSTQLAACTRILLGDHVETNFALRPCCRATAREADDGKCAVQGAVASAFCLQDEDCLHA